MLLLFFFLLLVVDRIRSCPLTDEYLSRCQCGILTNGESYIKCNERSLHEIPKFKRSFPYDELRLTNNYIQNLSSASFDTIKTIKRINLEGNALSFIDPDLLRLLGNYLEELILTGDNEIDSLEFLTRYPLKKLRLLQLNQFNLSEVDLNRIFVNMTKLDTLSLRSCQLQHVPSLDRIPNIDFEDNRLSDTIFLSTSYSQMNLARNQISSIVLQNNPNLVSLNLSKNFLKEFYAFNKFNEKFRSLDLSDNQFSSIDWNMFGKTLTHLNLSGNYLFKINLNFLPENLRELSVKNNSLKQIFFSKTNSSLLHLDLSANRLKTMEKNSLVPQLRRLDLDDNPLECNCHLQWLKQLLANSSSTINGSTWTCAPSRSSPFLSADFKCQSKLMPRVTAFNLTFVSLALKQGLLIQWSIVDEYQTIDYLQISIEQPYRLSRKLVANQTNVFLSKTIQSNTRYHVCLILFHRYARDKYCREIYTYQAHTLRTDLKGIHNDDDDDESLFLDQQSTTAMPWNEFNEKNYHFLLLGSCLGGLVTILLILTCCYLCYQIHRYKARRPGNHPRPGDYQRCSTHPTERFPSPLVHTFSPCPHHQIIYNSENISNSTDSSHFDSSFSATMNNPNKHIYQTIDSQDYYSLRKQNRHLFDLWNETVTPKR